MTRSGHFNPVFKEAGVLASMSEVSIGYCVQAGRVS